jgi:hypothetical protein
MNEPVIRPRFRGELTRGDIGVPFPNEQAFRGIEECLLGILTGRRNARAVANYRVTS